MSLHRRPQQGQSAVSVRASHRLLFADDVVLVGEQIDRLYDWKKSPETDVAATLKKQKKNTKDEFDERAKSVIVEFAQQVTNRQ